MFELLTQILLWLIIAVILYNLFKKVIPKEYFTLLGALLLFGLIVIAFFFPDNNVVSTLWNVMSFPLKPVGASIVLLSLALRNGLKAKNQVVAALLILLISSTPFFANLLAQGAEQQAFTPQEAATQTASAIVVLGQGTTQPNLPPRTQIQLTDTGDRILYAAQLYRESGNQPLVIASAGPRPNLEGSGAQVAEANDIRTLLVQLGVPQNQIVVEPKGTDLRTSAEAVEDILRNRGLADNRVFLVTSAFNSRRAQRTFAEVGLTNIVAKPTNFFRFQPGATPRLRIQIESFVPSVEALTVTTRIVEEFLSRLYYLLRGWLGGELI
ncbi:MULTISPECIES: YdcF family protein [unclassified Coleofasciculus]|uniref:YdcF family protein n=1 Tax=unclassified Coleofasciculus TaxID=2692782 RepID=UPI0018817C77|nr:MULTISPECIES: YdcF family protein [unclassified Coleofasciculus]MBE9125155.1 YdcF family protein [Coleofasciculus sp. LEGE 07081]MBE9148372.1 YdcF family protein [Coleofasciculus sp. LEGE 07092]